MWRLVGGSSATRLLREVKEAILCPCRRTLPEVIQNHCEIFGILRAVHLHRREFLFAVHSAEPSDRCETGH